MIFLKQNLTSIIFTKLINIFLFIFFSLKKKKRDGPRQGLAQDGVPSPVQFLAKLAFQPIKQSGIFK